MAEPYEGPRKSACSSSGYSRGTYSKPLLVVLPVRVVVVVAQIVTGHQWPISHLPLCSGAHWWRWQPGEKRKRRGRRWAVLWLWAPGLGGGEPNTSPGQPRQSPRWSDQPTAHGSQPRIRTSPNTAQGPQGLLNFFSSSNNVKAFNKMMAF